jgi:hypothetical protein
MKRDSWLLYSEQSGLGIVQSPWSPVHILISDLSSELISSSHLRLCLHRLEREKITVMMTIQPNLHGASTQNQDP